MYSINKWSSVYDDINHHPDMIYELKLWQDIKDDMGYSEKDNNNGYTYGIYWLDDNDEVVAVEWFKTEKDRYDEVKITNNRLRNAFYDEVVQE